jgi:hypothetical protein
VAPRSGAGARGRTVIAADPAAGTSSEKGLPHFEHLAVNFPGRGFLTFSECRQ